MERLLLREGLIQPEFHPLPHPYHIRVKGLTDKLTNDELATALLHIAKRRGSSLEVAVEEGGSAEDDMKAKENLGRNARILQENGWFVCQLQLSRLQERGFVRGTDNIFQTEDYVKEAQQILSNQHLSEDFVTKMIDILSRRRHFSEGPGSYTSPTPYGRFRRDEEGNVNEEPLNLIELMRGRCSIYPEELRAPKESFSAELHNFLNDLNNLRLPGEPERLTTEQKDAIVAEIVAKGYLKPKSNQPKGLADLLGIELDQIRGFRIDNKDHPILTEFKGYQKLLKVLGKNSKVLHDVEKLDRIAEILTSTKVLDERKRDLVKLDLPAKDVEALAALGGFTQYHSLSLKALRLLNKEMRLTNRNQMQIIHEENLIAKKTVPKLVIDDEAILSPVVKRAQRETLKVIEELMAEFGTFRKIVIETTRAKNSKDERQQIRKRQKLNEERNQEVDKLAEAAAGHDVELSGKQRLKLKLYKEQDGKCAYTYNPLNIQAILGNTDDYEIDHIIPYSISLDNSYHNKVLVEKQANQRKGNRSPFAYFQSGQAYGMVSDYHQFKQLVLANKKYSRNKKLHLTNEEDIYKYDMQKGFIARNLVDTSYAVRTLMNTLQTYFKANDIPTIVFTMKGKNTSLYRGLGAYEFDKRNPQETENALAKDRDHYKHHAIDALICAALAEQESLKRMYAVYRSESCDDETGEILYDFTPFDDSMLLEFLVSLGHIKDEDVRFSWKIDTKPNRSFSDETIYSTRSIDNVPHVVKKHKNIYDMDQSKLKSWFEGKDKEKLLVYQNDPDTFAILEGIYHQYKHEKKPFGAYLQEHGEKIRKYSKKNNGPFITNLKYIDKKLGSHLDISHNYNVKDKQVVLLQISPYRTDFYQRPDGSIGFVTIRRADLHPQGDSYNRYYTIDEGQYQEKLKEKNLEDAVFLHSFNRNEVIEIVSDNGDGTENVQRYRYVATNNDIKNVIEVKSIESKDSKPQVMLTIGRKTRDIRKYAVSPAGKMKKVEREQLKLRV
jgi:CRISPR-associated endonuclease Csn1